jgi:hypothetical protein
MRELIYTYIGMELTLTLVAGLILATTMMR